MTRTAVVLLAALTWTGSTWAASYQVTNVKNSGTGSLRWALAQADVSPGSDTITFAPALSGKAIGLKSLLAVFGSGITVDGDINNDGLPDIFLNGSALPTGHDGIAVNADDCTLIGLAIGNCPRFGVMASDVESFTLRSCHVGVTRSGNTLAKNGQSDVYLQRCTGCTIGGTAAAHRNVIAGGSNSPWVEGVLLYQCTNCTISGNYLGLKRNGLAPLGAGGVGVILYEATPPSTGNTIGGDDPGAGNAFGGLDYGVIVRGADQNVIAGNTFGLAADGSRLAPIVMACIRLALGADHNRIGGRTAAEKNVFAGAGTGVVCDDAATKDNTIEGNYFGLNTAGSGIRRLTYGVFVNTGGTQTIGGSAAGAGNYFIPTTSTVGAYGVLIQASGGGTLVQGNHFGVRPSGSDVARRQGGAIDTSAACRIIDNTITSLTTGVSPYGAGAKPRILRNTFRKCTRAVDVGGGAKPVLGNLGNASAADDGGNVFAKSNTWYIYNDTASNLKAEGNLFGTTVKSQIDAKVYDKLDLAGRGRVDFDPLQGGVHPSDAGGMLALAGAIAVPTDSGAEIVFSLSAPAAVTIEVLNLAGRPIATPVHQDARPAGMNRVVWSGLAATGLAAPPGRYLIRLRAQDADGRQTSALCPVLLR